MWLRAVLICAVIAGCEVLHGMLRIRLLNPQVGDRRARQIAVGTGSLLNFGVAWLAFPWLTAAKEISAAELWGVGGLWLGLMLALDLAFGRWVFHFSWARIGRDFDPRRGGLLGIGMLLLFVTPWLVGWLRNQGLHGAGI